MAPRKLRAIVLDGRRYLWRLGHRYRARRFATAVARLLDLVRLPSGDLHDDVSVVQCRRRG